MKENLKKAFLDLRKFDEPINSLDLIKAITSNPLIENDPFYIVDLEDICNKHVKWITKLPRVEPHYAIKCNTDPMLLKLLAYLGTGFDCASKNEIQTVLDLGVSPSRIIFANPCKQASNVRYAYRMGVDQMTFDNEFELYKIRDTHPNAKCVLRIITNDENAVCQFSMKFGADMDTALSLIDLAIRLGINLVGISFHVGSGQMSPSTFTESIENARRLFDYAEEKHSCRMNLLDLGGGYPGSNDLMHLFDTVSEEINRTLDALFPPETNVRIIAEPGRYYAASAFTLAVNVIAKRTVSSSKKESKEEEKTTKSVVVEKKDEKEAEQKLLNSDKSIMYYINDGVYASFNCMFYDHAICEPVLLRKNDLANKTDVYKSSIWGPTCDGLDCVTKECTLPELNVGEFLAFEDMGAYTLSGAVAFNGIPLPRCIYVAAQSWDSIKAAFDDSHLEEPFINNLTPKKKSEIYNPLVNSCAIAAYRAATSGSNNSNESNNNSESDDNGVEIEDEKMAKNNKSTKNSDDFNLNQQNHHRTHSTTILAGDDNQ